jgi:hypothetical protein
MQKPPHDEPDALAAAAAAAAKALPEPASTEPYVTQPRRPQPAPERANLDAVLQQIDQERTRATCFAGR